MKFKNPILFGLLYTFGLGILLALIFTLLLYFTSLSDANLNWMSYITTLVSLIVGGFVAGKRAGVKGWYYGGLTGLIYGVVILIIAFLAFNSKLNLQSLVLVALSFLFGSSGGIFGVNMSKK